jgi:hypothetical protein
MQQHAGRYKNHVCVSEPWVALVEGRGEILGLISELPQFGSAH